MTDCAGLAESIYTGVDLQAYIGQVITLADETNHEIEGCWIVSESFNCVGTIDVAIYKCHDTCEDCLPTPLPPQIPCPRPVDPGYDTGLCDSDIVEKAKCSFAEVMYQKMMAIRFAIKYCCMSDEQSVIMSYEKINMKLMESKNPTPDPCNPKCLDYNVTIPAGDSGVTTYLNCDDEASEIITVIGTTATTVTFCGLDSQPPVTVMTHPDTTIDTYVLEPNGDCTLVPNTTVEVVLELFTHTVERTCSKCGTIPMTWIGEPYGGGAVGPQTLDPVPSIPFDICAVKGSFTFDGGGLVIADNEVCLDPPCGATPADVTLVLKTSC